MTEHKWVRVGDHVVIVGWRKPASRDIRMVMEMRRERCESGVMVRLDKPLHNGPVWVDFNWIGS